jgi:hypothetical protein
MLASCFNWLLDPHFHRDERALNDPLAHFAVDPLRQAGRVLDQCSVPEPLPMAVIP